MNAAPSLSPELDPSHAQRLLARLRLLGYGGVQFSALLVPLLVFQVTGSASLAGAALVVEWLPKLALYLVGGSLIQRFSGAAVHVSLDVARLVALCALLASALGFGGLWLVAAAAATYQCANALSNVLFERAVTQWWPRERHSAGHALLLQRDQLGCFLVLAFALTVSMPEVLAAVALVLQALALGLVLHARGVIHRESRPHQRANLWAQIRGDLGAVAHRPPAGFAVMALMLAVPAATVLSSILFYLDQAEPKLAQPAAWMAGILLARAGISLLALEWVKKRLLPGADKRLAVAGFVLSLVAAVPLIVPGTTGLVLAVSIVVLGTASCFYLPWLRAERQALIERLVPAQNRRGATGVLIAVEACSYLIGAGLLVALGDSLPVLAIAAAAFGAAGAVLAMFQLRTSPVTVDTSP